MNTYTKSIIVAAGLLAALPAAFAAPGDPVTQVRGTVSAVDATAKTITVQGRGGQTTTVLHVSDATKYYTDGTGALSDLKVGETIRVRGMANGTAITATGITVLPAEEASLPAPAARPGGGAGGGGGRRGGTMGVVASVSPLTITLPDKSTDTVTTDTTTTVTVPKAGTIADVKAQGNVSALTTGTGDAATATEIHVQAAFGGGRGGAGGGFGGAGGAGAGGAGGGNGAAGGGRRRRGGGGAGGGAGAPGGGANGGGAGAPGGAMPAGQ